MNNRLRVTNGVGPIAENAERAAILALGFLQGDHQAWISCGVAGTFEVSVAKDGKWMFACTVTGPVERMRDDIRAHAQRALEGFPLEMPVAPRLHAWMR
jgi:hypothetical protein